MRLAARLAATAALAFLAGPAIAQQAVDDFIAGNGHARVELEPLLAKYRLALIANAATTSLPDEGMGPLEKAALFVDAVEGELPIARWLYRLGQTSVPASTGGEETLWSSTSRASTLARPGASRRLPTMARRTLRRPRNSASARRCRGASSSRR